MNILETGIKNVRNATRYSIGAGALADLPKVLANRRAQATGSVVYFIDEFFRTSQQLIDRLAIQPADQLIFVASKKEEPSTDGIDGIVADLRGQLTQNPCAIVGMGGGSTMDTAKAVANLLTNGGRAEDYQGWDLVKVPGIYKIAVPTLSGTGAEATRTCVMTNARNGLKLGMNSDYTVYDEIVLDPDLPASAPRDQYFYTGIDAYIHCFEALAGHYRNAIGDAFSRETLNLCRQVFLQEDMMSAAHREQLMVASYLGGCAIATSYVGLVHPFSAGLSVVLGIRHCLANCLVMHAMEPWYPREYEEFWRMAEHQGIEIPTGIGRDLTPDQYQALYEATMIHEKPLTNALGEHFRDILTPECVTNIFSQM
ncbi:iron-containing alcohol dehydrogenase family protein [Thiorhodovibrio frisius]|uniref:Alcohol dehydrogenase, class IV n=1 Tax=Thiorhodovibrio frisius TaxID=631362 RepID=H8Z099_9GAMM|nr:iron-containing alcohol dehydrogenase family protein [Thiorhodovibrio frisius]EIC22307.1 alcohol dehydrogenase, class IV [Thiorhodovibrio frisius]WPL24604.1 NAD-dependent methanol dehydrogenase [Thiorhodovibrio frisius]